MNLLNIINFYKNKLAINILILVIFSIISAVVYLNSSMLTKKKYFFTVQIHKDILTYSENFSKFLRSGDNKKRIFDQVFNTLNDELNNNFKIDRLIRLSHNDGDSIRIYFETKNEISKQNLVDIIEKDYFKTMFMDYIVEFFLNNLQSRINSQKFIVNRTIYNTSKKIKLNEAKISFYKKNIEFSDLKNVDITSRFQAIRYEFDNMSLRFDLESEQKYLAIINKLEDNSANWQNPTIYDVLKFLENFHTEIDSLYTHNRDGKNISLPDYMLIFMNNAIDATHVLEKNIHKDFNYEFSFTDYSKFKKFLPIIFVMLYMIVVIFYYNLHSIVKYYKEK